MSKAIGGQPNGLSSKPNFYDGAMLANDAEFYLYGGVYTKNPELYINPAADSVLKYQAYQTYMPTDDKPRFHQGFQDAHLDDGVTRYISYGAAANAPSENKAWYFSGMTSATHGPLYWAGGNASERAVNMSNTLITLDMSTQMREKWSNSTLPVDIKARSAAEIVWVPVGKQGILVVLGGVTFPEWATVGHESENAKAGTGKKEDGDEFMRVVDIYDVASGKWYRQPTKQSPGGRARGCAVVAVALDRSSFNIYYYGGFDGVLPKEDFYDDVWVLSMPSFTWTQINNGTTLHARSGHKCFMPYPDQMMAFGGYAAEAGAIPSCLDKGPVVIFNLTSGEWMDSYDPLKHGQYGVHQKVQSVIGGGSTGGATLTTPVPSGWATSALADVFEEKYDMKKMTTHWPYVAATSTGRPALVSGRRGGAGDDKNSVIIPAVVVPTVFLLGVGLIAWLCLVRKRRRSDETTSHGSSPDDATLHIRSWITGQHAKKPSTVTSSEAIIPSPDLAKADPDVAISPEAPVQQHEMADTQVVELGGDSLSIPFIPSPSLSALLLFFSISILVTHNLTSTQLQTHHHQPSSTIRDFRL
ncbi:Galactose oxidase/kelch, beta-propeller [Drechmeria coniospora]|uniref:Galactose oxidase/kelch, beta-propeller n=1 Tax=Drechmeria coniospora TaxID=98403 RepID=A0A151GQ37_DRECN|nr:Galactose oxidase/kelch, beta-propeller [Drechmeria coniospora]KYK59234.1 Galactose oxidase/kelch, beta-propeller [Drechmeria coniospora]